MAIPPDPKADSEALLAREIEHLNSDLIGVQEVDYFLARSGNHNQVAQVATIRGAAEWAFAPSLIGSPDEKWRNPDERDEKVITNRSQVASEGYGIGIVSKLPVTSWHRLELKGAPLGLLMVFPVDGKLKPFYVRDHPRSALAAILDNGWLVINTHLSFVPFFNLIQLRKIKKWSNTLGVSDKSKIIIMGDMNIPISGLVAGLKWNSLATQRTYPSWKPKAQLDFFLSQQLTPQDIQHLQYPHAGMSDHLPLQIELDVN